MAAPTVAHRPGIDVLVETVASGAGAARTRAAGRLMTLLEEAPHRLAELYPALPAGQWRRPRLILGVTGAPGSGKSTLVDAMLAELRRAFPAWTLGVIAVDPSSPFTGGAVLGDRVRMMRHATDPHVFIRSLASRGRLGGLSLGVKGVLRVMGLLGCDVVIIETVGVGQSEVEIARVADTVCVVLAPGAGDSIQLLKAGLMEVGDVFIVNKADTPGADSLHRALLQALGPPAADPGDTRTGRRPDIVLASATTGDGVGGLVGLLLGADATGGARIGAARDSSAEARDDVRDAVLEAARRRLVEAIEREPVRLDRILAGTLTVGEAVQQLFTETPRP
jgi:LAO/AO transport system kinase